MTTPRLKNGNRLRQRRWRMANPERDKAIRHASYIRMKYGITIGEYNSMLSSQNGVCAICKFPPKSMRLATDHNHKDGKVRGLLCFRCNTAIGKIERSYGTVSAPEFLLKIREYLLRPIPLGLENER